MIDAALESEQGETVFMKYLAPFVEKVVDIYCSEQKINYVSPQILVEEAWKYFNMALRNYRSRADAMIQGKQKVYYFETYFAWFIKQSVLEYLKSHPQKS